MASLDKSVTYGKRCSDGFGCIQNGHCCGCGNLQQDKPKLTLFFLHEKVGEDATAYLFQCTTRQAGLVIDIGCGMGVSILGLAAVEVKESTEASFVINMWQQLQLSGRRSESAVHQLCKGHLQAMGDQSLRSIWPNASHEPVAKRSFFVSKWECSIAYDPFSQVIQAA
jgi:hypothetical protein